MTTHFWRATILVALFAFTLASGPASLAQTAQAPSQPPAQATPALPPATPLPAAVRATLDRLEAAAATTTLAYDLTAGLSTEVGPRLAGSPAEGRARDWAVAQLRQLGFDEVRVEPFTVAYWRQVSVRAEIVGPSAQPLVAVALGGSPGTPRGGLEGEIVRFASLEALDEATAADVRGKIVLIDEPMAHSQDGSTYGHAVRKRRLCAPMAQARGALACLIRSVGDHHDRFAQQGGNPRQPAGVAIPALAISPPDAEQLSRLLTRGPVRVRLMVEVEMREAAPSGNVIAELRGRERPEEIVLLGAHLDSWDQATGALDDAAGIGIVTAAAHLIAQLPERPRRTIRIVYFGSEETGILGAEAYARRHQAQLANHVLAAESDFGAGPIWRLQTRFGPSALPHARAMARSVARFRVIPGGNEANGGPDLTPLRQAGVPILDPSQDGSDYFTYHHTPNDTLDKVDGLSLRQNVGVYALVAYLAAEMPWDFRAPASP